LAKLALTGAIAFGLAALALIPAFDLPKYTVRAEMTYPQASEFAIPPAGLISLFAPGFFGRGTGPFWGPWLRTEMGYAGVLPLMLAVIAVVLAFRRDSLLKFWLLLGLSGFLIAMGSYTALHGWTYALLPFFRQLRVPARAIFLFDFAVAVLAAIGLDLLLRPMSRPMRHTTRLLNWSLVWVAGTVALVGVPLLGHAVLVARVSTPDLLAQTVTSLNSLIFFLILFASGLVWLVLRRRGLVGRKALGVLAVVIIAFDLISLGAYIEIEPNDPVTGYQKDDMIAFLEANPDIFRVKVLAGAPVNWPPDWALVHEMDDWDGIWNPLRLGAYDVLTWIGINQETPYHNLYNVKYVIAHKDNDVPARLEPVFEKGEGVIYLDPQALPRAFMVYEAQVVNSAIKALNTAKKADFDPARQIVLEKEFDVAPLSVEPGSGERQVEIVDRGPNHLDIHVVTPVEGYLFVSEMWMPDWVAVIDGEKHQVARANFTFRAVYLEPGTHDIHMVYRPRSWAIGLGLTLGTLVLLGVWGLWLAIRRRQARFDRQSSIVTKAPQ
jgi:hypothetical protein